LGSSIAGACDVGAAGGLHIARPRQSISKHGLIGRSRLVVCSWFDSRRCRFHCSIVRWQWPEAWAEGGSSMAGTEKHVVHGRMVENVSRAPQQVIDRLARHDTAKICDSMGGEGAMHHEIKPLENDMRVIGSALTVLTKPGDALYVQKAIDMTRPGDVVVIAASGYKDVCVIGERLGYFFKLKGAVGIIVDGAVRDASGMVASSPPTFARATCIRIFGSTGPGAINVPVTCGGVLVNPGDIIVGDRDGVVVVPREDAERVAALADAHLEGELARMKMVEDGRSVTEVFSLQPKLDRWNT
jgi:4-hydroxy-4-methyl-2-oxoglutarate aldolase